MSSKLREFKTKEEFVQDERAMVATMLSGVSEIAGIVPEESLSDQYCRQIVKLFKSTHKIGERLDLARLAAAQGGSASDLMAFARGWRVSADDALAIARLFRQRHEGGILAAELENNTSYLRYGFDSVEAAERCQKALEKYQKSVTGEVQNTTIQSIINRHGGRLLVSRQEGGLPFNLPSFDKNIGGLHRGELIVFAARPKRGKSVVLATTVVTANVPTVIFSLEMTAEEYLRMLVCNVGQIPSDELRNRLSDIDAAKEELARRKIDIVDTPSLTVNDIATYCFARRGVRLIVVDYLQILGKMRGAESSRESLVESIKGLKVLAKRVEATVIAGSQVSREGDDKPSTRHLAESDEILRSADAVLVMDWVEDNPPPESAYMRSPVEVNFSLTNRHGPSSKFPMAFYRSQRRFGELTAN